MMERVHTLAPIVGMTATCQSLGVPCSTVYRHQRPAAVRRQRTVRRHPRMLSPDEQTTVRAVLNSEHFVDHARRTVYATLLDEGIYLCHWRTMDRLLRADAATCERRAVRRHPVSIRPELLATAPRQVWSWDITNLRGPQPGVWYSLYVVLDIFSRMIVGWLLATHEAALLAEQVLADACLREGISPEQLTIHADLGVRRSRSRPTVSNDNPYSEAQFKTMKDVPTYLDRFASLADARAWVTAFVDWYNHVHRHSGLSLLTPAMVHRGTADAVVAAAADRHPERFVQGPPTPPPVPTAAWIINAFIGKNTGYF